MNAHGQRMTDHSSSLLEAMQQSSWQLLHKSLPELEKPLSLGLELTYTH